MPADVQYVDWRERGAKDEEKEKAPVLLQPLRDCVLKDLTLVCRFQKWETLTPSISTMIDAAQLQNLNTLTAQFVAQLQV